MPPATDRQLQMLIDKSLAGDRNAKEDLLDHACERLMSLTRKMLNNYPGIHRWEQTDDIFQNSMIRLHRALIQVRIESTRHFFNLAALQIRRELVDAARKYFGPEGLGKNHHTDSQPSDDLGGALHNRANEPDDISTWTEFHVQVDQLPPEELEVVNLLFYEGLTQEEAANVLGISFRTLKRRWQSAKLKLYKELTSE